MTTEVPANFINLLQSSDKKQRSTEDRAAILVFAIAAGAGNAFWKPARNRDRVYQSRTPL